MQFPLRGGMTYRPHRRRGIAGFTLTELMITIIIAGIVLAIAGPRFMRYISHLSARSATSHVVADLTLTRAQAVREGRTTSFQIMNDGTGYTVVVSGPTPRVIKTVNLRREFPGVAVTPAGGTFSFDSRGLLTQTPGQVTIARGGLSDNVSVSMVGRVIRDR
jgi:prepilin-type N-terminal cleavage/methylation domain-containing protein